MQRSKHWVFTLNNWTEDEYEAVTKTDCVYLVVGKEVGETGTKHLQGYIVMPSLKSLAQMKKVIGDRAHLERAKGTASQNFVYCSKDSDFMETGLRPADPGRSGGECQKERWRIARMEAEAGLEQTDDHIAVVHGNAIESMRMRVLRKRKLEHTTERMLWWWGNTGTGKSRKAWETYPDAYPKMCNKWWDAYTDEEVVIIEDFDAAHGVLGHHMKIWGDRYPFLAEVKGGSMKIRPKLIVVTSNYPPEAIWSNKETLEPILRRFEVTEIKE